jgi:hypothetical protein
LRLARLSKVGETIADPAHPISKRFSR